MDNRKFLPQKVLHLKDELAKKNPKLQGEYILTEKFEGWYVTIYFDGRKFHNPISSASLEIPAFAWVANSLNERMRYAKVLDANKTFQLIAEAYIEDTPFEVLNGIFNRSKGNCSCYDVVFKLHDAVPNTSMTAFDRLVFSREVLETISAPFLHYVHPLYIGAYNKDIWQRYFGEIAEKGGEGIVAKRMSSIYRQGKRNSDLLKLKLECTREALAIRLEEGVGEKGNPSLTLISQRSNGTEIRTVISKHTDQALFRNDPTSVIGKVVQIRAMEEYEDLQLRQPVFQFLREDKSPEDID